MCYAYCYSYDFDGSLIDVHIPSDLLAVHGGSLCVRPVVVGPRSSHTLICVLTAHLVHLLVVLGQVEVRVKPSILGFRLSHSHLRVIL